MQTYLCGITVKRNEILLHQDGSNLIRICEDDHSIQLNVHEGDFSAKLRLDLDPGKDGMRYDVENNKVSFDYDGMWNFQEDQHSVFEIGFKDAEMLKTLQDAFSLT
jgi:hypothetical protein